MATNTFSGSAGHVTTDAIRPMVTRPSTRAQICVTTRLVRGDFARPTIVLTVVFSLACLVLTLISHP